jgi:hypothetical protein
VKYRGMKERRMGHLKRRENLRGRDDEQEKTDERKGRKRRIGGQKGREAVRDGKERRTDELNFKEKDVRIK